MAVKHYYIIILSVLILFGCMGNDQKSKESKTQEFDTANLPTNKQVEKKLESSLHIGGTYSFGDNVEKGPVGSVRVYPLTNNIALFFLDVCRGAPSYNLGQLFGQMTIKNDIGTYNSKIYNADFNCILQFKFSSKQLEVITESGHEDCGFGGNVYADGIYKLIDKSIPKYFIDGHGDTTFFEGLTVEKYEHRFD